MAINTFDYNGNRYWYKDLESMKLELFMYEKEVSYFGCNSTPLIDKLRKRIKCLNLSNTQKNVKNFKFMKIEEDGIQKNVLTTDTLQDGYINSGSISGINTFPFHGGQEGQILMWRNGGPEWVTLPPSIVTGKQIGRAHV